MLFGGGDGNRTHVRRPFNGNLYVRSRSIGSRDLALRPTGSQGRQPERISPERPQTGVLEPARFFDARFRLRRLNRNGRAALKRPLHTSNRLQLNLYPVVLRGQLEPRHAASVSSIPVEACRPHEDVRRTA